MKEIISAKNQKIKELKKLQQRKYRNKSAYYLIEGFHLVEEAKEIKEIFIDQKGSELWHSWLKQQTAAIYLLSDEAMAALSEFPTPQGIVALVKKNQSKPQQFTGKWLLLDNVQDPGNVGTMVRTADAAGFSGIVLGKGTADQYSHKVLRSMQGSQFHLPVIEGDLREIIPQLQKAGKVYGTKLDEQALVYDQVVNEKNIALLMGNEGQGVSAELLQITDANLYIPIYGQAESLNVGIAAGILMYHFAK
ncbi:MAG TPA: RNA methyltransferase [Tetragenococcus sp.]|nr:RNA methyltransferase [Tetragenococcus sp.]